MVLCSLFLSGVLLSVVLQGRNVEFFTGTVGALNADGTSYPILLGIVPLRLLLLVWALLCILWISELFSARAAIFLSFSAGLTVGFVWLLLQAIPLLPTPADQVIWDSAYGTIFGIDFAVFASTASQVALGFTAVALTYAMLRRLTHNSLHLVRLIISSFVGSAIPPLLEAFFGGLFEGSQGLMLSLLVTRYAQWLSLFLITIPFYYLFELLWKILLGSKHLEEVRQRYAKAPIVQGPPDFFENREELQDKRMFPHPTEVLDEKAI